MQNAAFWRYLKKIERFQILLTVKYRKERFFFERENECFMLQEELKDTYCLFNFLTKKKGFFVFVEQMVVIIIKVHYFKLRN